MDNERSEKQALKPVTIRFSAEAWDAIENLAKEHGTNKTELIRITLAGNLARYLGDVRIIDDEQAAEIKDLIKALLNEVSEIKLELHRIGVNYNQEIRLRNIARKYAKSGNDVATLLQRHTEEEAVTSECRGFSQKDVDGLIARYEAATEKVGRLLCRILA